MWGPRVRVKPEKEKGSKGYRAGSISGGPTWLSSALRIGSRSGSQASSGCSSRERPARFGPSIGSSDLGWLAKAVWAGGVAAAHLFFSSSSLL